MAAPNPPLPHQRRSQGAAHVASVCLALLLLLAALLACRGTSSTAVAIDAGSSTTVVTSVPAPTHTVHLPPEPSPPAADLASEVPKLEAKLAADAPYAAVWSGQRADLDLFLTYVSEVLATTGAPTSIAQQLDAKRLKQAGINLYLVFTRTNAFPADFTNKLKAHLASTKTEPHLGVWAPYKKGAPIHDYSALAAWVNREDADYFREHIAAKKTGPFDWGMPEGTKPDRPYLVYELDALSWLEKLDTLTPQESARRDQLRADTAAVHISAAKLVADFAANEVRADATYKGKAVVVSGTVVSVEKHLGDIVLTIGAGGEFETSQVSCYLDDADAKRAATLDKGDRVTVRGRVTGLMMNVILEKCGIPGGA